MAASAKRCRERQAAPLGLGSRAQPGSRVATLVEASPVPLALAQSRYPTSPLARNHASVRRMPSARSTRGAYPSTRCASAIE